VARASTTISAEESSRVFSRLLARAFKSAAAVIVRESGM